MNTEQLWSDAVRATKAHAEQLARTKSQARELELPEELKQLHGQIVDCEAKGFTALAEALRNILIRQVMELGLTGVCEHLRAPLK